eukprot:1221054-Prymnesium_polylepis.2
MLSIPDAAFTRAHHLRCAPESKVCDPSGAAEEEFEPPAGHPTCTLITCPPPCWTEASLKRLASSEVGPFRVSDRPPEGSDAAARRCVSQLARHAHFAFPQIGAASLPHRVCSRNLRPRATRRNGCDELLRAQTRQHTLEQIAVKYERRCALAVRLHPASTPEESERRLRCIAQRRSCVAQRRADGRVSNRQPSDGSAQHDGRRQSGRGQRILHDAKLMTWAAACLPACLLVPWWPMLSPKAVSGHYARPA